MTSSRGDDNIKGSLSHCKLASLNDNFNENESTLNQSGCQPCVKPFKPCIIIGRWFALLPFACLNSSSLLVALSHLVTCLVISDSCDTSVRPDRKF